MYEKKGGVRRWMSKSDNSIKATISHFPTKTYESGVEKRLKFVCHKYWVQLFFVT